MIEDINIMRSAEVQHYYANQYLNYQRRVIERNELFERDNKLLRTLIALAKLNGNLLDIGCGSCRWAPYLINDVTHYYGVDINLQALSQAPAIEKLSVFQADIFNVGFGIAQLTPGTIDTCFYSFFLSHYSNDSIKRLINKLSAIKNIILFDSYWGESHQTRYITKELALVPRKISLEAQIQLPKRFFVKQDIIDLFIPFGYSLELFTAGNYFFGAYLTNNQL